MKFLATIAALAAFAAAAPIIDLSGKGPGDDMLTKRYVDTSAEAPGEDMLSKRQSKSLPVQRIAGTDRRGFSATASGLTGSLNSILGASALGGASGSIVQSPDLGASVLSGVGNLANLPAAQALQGGTTAGVATAQGAGTGVGTTAV